MIILKVIKDIFYKLKIAVSFFVPRNFKKVAAASEGQDGDGDKIRAWHLNDADRLKHLKRIHRQQKITLAGVIITPLFYLLFFIFFHDEKGSIHPIIFTINFFVLQFMILIPYYLRMTFARRQLELRRLVSFKDLDSIYHWL